MDSTYFVSADIIARFFRTYMNNQRDLPIRPSEMGVLIFISQSTRPVTPLSISEFFSISKPSVTSTITMLLKKGYLEKRKSESDLRSYQLILTEKASILIEETAKFYFSTIEMLQNKMGQKDFDQLITLMQIATAYIERNPE